jgi:hypothetical protein
LRFIAFFVGGLPLRERCAPAKINGLATGGAERETPDVEHRGRLTVTGHDGGEISPRDHVEQFLLVDRKTRPDLRQVVDRVDVGNDGVMAGALKSLVMETAACALSDDRGIGHRDRAERLPRLQARHDLGIIDQGWFWFGNQGLSYIQLGRFWQIGFFIGLALWSVLVMRALWPTTALWREAAGQFWPGRIRMEHLIWASTINIAVL